MTKIDGVLRAVLVNNLSWITEEMNEYMCRSAYSLNIAERKDCSSALYTKNGDLIAQGMFIPGHLGSMSESLKKLFEIHSISDWEEGDMLIQNDPFLMGSHIWDVMVFKPIFHDGELIAFAGTIAHHTDMGGSSIRYRWHTCFEEGLRIPGVKIVKRGELQEDVLRFINSNNRNPYQVTGDLMAQMAALRRADERITALAEKYGNEMLCDYFEAALDYSEEGMRNTIAMLPDGEATFEDIVEFDGVSYEAEMKVKVKLTIKGSDITVDFSGSAGPAYGGVNIPMSWTNASAYYAVKAVVGPQVPTNAGAYRCIHVPVPTGPNGEKESLLNAQPPAATIACTMVVPQRLVDITIGAFAKICPEKACACDGHWGCANMAGQNSRTGRYFIYAETYGTGHGAKYNEDGMTATQTHITNTANTPTEMIERSYPFFVKRYAIAEDTGGAGEYRGGCGLVREIYPEVEVAINTVSSRNMHHPYGLYGGLEAEKDQFQIQLPGQETQGPECRMIPANTRVQFQTAGGGGWGDPHKRDPKKVEWDVLNGYVSIEKAKTEYGMIVDPETCKVVGRV